MTTVPHDQDVVLWTPTAFEVTPMGQFASFVQQKTGLACRSYQALYDWSVTEYQQFWSLFLEYCQLETVGQPQSVLSQDQMWPVPKWFEGLSLNYAQNLLSDSQEDALIYYQEETLVGTWSASQLRQSVIQLAVWYQQQGVKPGDVVAGFVSHCPEAIVAFLATAALGAIWTACSPDSGVQYALDRFSQTQPKIFVATQAYYFESNWMSSSEKLEVIRRHLPTATAAVLISRTESIQGWTSFIDIVGEDKHCPQFEFPTFSFSHPLLILYSSGTTGKPKCIVHGAGGTLLQHLKEHRLHCELKPGDRFFYFTTTAWMMWNWQVGALASRCALVVYEGKADPQKLWKVVKESRTAVFGTSAPWLFLCQKLGISFSLDHFPYLRMMLSTGAPLLREQFDYIYASIKPDLQVASISGGTDIVSCFVLGGPVPVRRGRLQCRGLGMAVEVWNEAGKPVRNEEGELVCTKPFVCMPIYFLNDTDHQLYHNAYFGMWTGIWAHGDFAVLYEEGGMEILGRSDSTIKRKGVRIGTSDIYSALAALTDIEDALAVGKRGRDSEEIVLFLKLKADVQESPVLKKEIRNVLVAQSPHFKPDYIFFVQDIPYTANGKKSEVLVKNVLNGKPVTNQQSLRNPDCLDEYVILGEKLRG